MFTCLHAKNDELMEFTLFTTHDGDHEHDHDGGDEDMTEKLII